MRHLTKVFLAAVFFISMSTAAEAAMTNQAADVQLKKPLIKEDLTKSTRVVKKAKVKKLSTKAPAREKVVLDMDAKPSKKIAGNKKVVLDMDTKPVKKNKKRSVASVKKSVKKKYWSVQCHQGFIKDSYVYCARSTASIAPTKKNSSVKKVAMKKAKTSVRK